MVSKGYFRTFPDLAGALPEAKSCVDQNFDSAWRIPRIILLETISNVLI